MEQTHLPFLFKTIYEDNDGPLGEYSISHTPVPPKTVDSPFRSMSPDYSLLPSILQTIYQMHVETQKELYLDPEYGKNSTFMSLISIIKPYLGELIPIEIADQIGKSSWITIDAIKDYLTKDRLFLLENIRYHFLQLKSSGLYDTKEKRKKLFMFLLKLMIPGKMLLNNNFPLIDVFPDEENDWYVNYVSSDEIYLTTFLEFEPVEKVSFGNLWTNESEITFVSLEDRTSSIFYANDIDLWVNYLSCEHDSKNRIMEYFCNSFCAIPEIVDNLPDEFVNSYMKMLLTHDMCLHLPLFQTILESQNAKELSKDLYKIYLFNNQRLRLFKMFAYFEISTFAATPIEIYRQNNVFTLLITDFLRKQLSEFIENGIKKIQKLVWEQPYFDFDHPKEEDIPTIELLLDNFCNTMKESIQYITLPVSQFLRYLRLLCETFFGDETLNHRALIGIFLLRFIVPSFSAPENNMINGVIEQEGFKKSIAFSKVIMSLSTLEMNYTRTNERQFFNPILEKYIPKMVAFLTAITELDLENNSTPKEEEEQVMFTEVADAIQDFRKFFRNSREELIKRSAKFEQFEIPLFCIETLNTIFEYGTPKQDE